MTANTPIPGGKRGFLLISLLLAGATTALASDPGWRVTVVPSFERPALGEPIPGSSTASLAVARHKSYGELEYATTRGAWALARRLAEQNGGTWLMDAEVEFRRDANRVIDRIIITGEDPLLPSVVLAPAFYERFEPMLGDGFHVVIPERGTIALYPRLAGRIPPEEAFALLEINRLATYPVSREVFRARRGGLVADGILED